MVRTKRRRRTFALVAMLLALLAADQLLLHVVLSGGTVAGRRVAPFDPPLFAPVQFEFRDRLAAAVESGRDPGFFLAHDAELGWVPRNGGPRPAPGREGRSGEQRRVVAVGCSFTYGEEVEDHETWAVHLEALRPDLEVVNLGVSAYGVDQAWLRLQREGLPLQPAEVWLGVVPETLPRLESMYRPAHRHWTNLCWFKPRFAMRPDGTLELVPSPATTPSDTLRLLRDQESFVAAVGVHDRWVARSPVAYAPEGSRFAHHSGLGRILVTVLEAASRPAAVDLWYQPEDSAARLFLALAETIAQQVASSGAHFRILVLPGRGDLQRLHDASAGEGAGLTVELQQRGVDVVDLTPVLLEVDAGSDPSLWMSGGHYSSAGNRLVAEALARPRGR